MTGKRISFTWLISALLFAAQPGFAAEFAFNYDDYVRDFNSGDDAGLIEKYFAEDTVMISAGGIYRGHKGMNEFLAWAHDGVREILRPVAVVQDEHHLFAEIDMDFVASKPRTDFPFGDLQIGDIMTVKFLVHYTVNDEGKITELQTMTWDPEREVSRLPRLGTHPGQQAAFLAYTKAFSAGLAEQYSAFYQDDVELTIASVGTLKGKQAIVDFYTDMFRTVREELEINKVIYADDVIVGNFISVFRASADAPDFAVGPLEAGQAYRVPVLVYYTLEDGLISRIQVARFGEVELVE